LVLFFRALSSTSPAPAPAPAPAHSGSGSAPWVLCVWLSFLGLHSMLELGGVLGGVPGSGSCSVWLVESELKSCGQISSMCCVESILLDLASVAGPGADAPQPEHDSRGFESHCRRYEKRDSFSEGGADVPAQNWRPAAGRRASRATWGWRWRVWRRRWKCEVMCSEPCGGETSSLFCCGVRSCYGTLVVCYQS
jgi:hypothetical protein